MSQEAYDLPATPPSTPKRTTRELDGHREQKSIIDAALVSMIYEISKEDSPQQYVYTIIYHFMSVALLIQLHCRDIDPVAHGKWAALSKAQRIEVIKKAQASAVQLLNELPVADLPAGWQADNMIYMLRVDVSILARESRILTTIQDAFRKELVSPSLMNLIIGTKIIFRTFTKEILKFERSWSNLRGLSSARTFVLKRNSYRRVKR